MSEEKKEGAKEKVYDYRQQDEEKEAAYARYDREEREYIRRQLED